MQQDLKGVEQRLNQFIQERLKGWAPKGVIRCGTIFESTSCSGSYEHGLFKKTRVDLGGPQSGLLELQAKGGRRNALGQAITNLIDDVGGQRQVVHKAEIRGRQIR